jgi:hypothetical protein
MYARGPTAYQSQKAFPVSDRADQIVHQSVFHSECLDRIRLGRNAAGGNSSILSITGVHLSRMTAGSKLQVSCCHAA